MENKKTSELLDLLKSLIDKSGSLKEGYNEAYEELKTREPFFEILSEDMDNSLPLLAEQIEVLREEIKKLKRHKHEEKTGDVVVRI